MVHGITNSTATVMRISAITITGTPELPRVIRSIFCFDRRGACLQQLQARRLGGGSPGGSGGRFRRQPPPGSISQHNPSLTGGVLVRKTDVRATPPSRDLGSWRPLFSLPP